MSTFRLLPVPADSILGRARPLPRVQDVGVDAFYMASLRDRLGAGLSAQELNCLRSAAVGHTHKEIAADLGISAQTVKNHLWKSYRKLGADNIVEALNRLGWVRVGGVPVDVEAAGLRAALTAVANEAATLAQRLGAVA